MPRYAAARESDGLKPWVVVRRQWGKTDTYIVWAEDARAAEYTVRGRQLYVSAKARRATDLDLTSWREFR